MGETISQSRFQQELIEVLIETFETPRGIFLDRGTSMLETLDTISAEEASRPVGGKCATLAAQVAHVTFYLEVLERYMLTGDSGKVDWGEIWRTVQGVTQDQWSASKGKLRETYQRVLEMLQTRTNWDDETGVGGALAVLAHSTYHLGEIRQALCTLK